MKESTSNTIQEIVKYLIYAGVIASIFFIGWRVATKGEYERRELAQCEALAVSAAFTAAGALDKPELAAYIRESGATEFIIDHMKMPGHNVVSVTISPEGGGFSVAARAATGWNSRSPQHYEFTVYKDGGGLQFPDESKTAKAYLALNAEGAPAAEELLTFTFPHEQKCPVPFDAEAAEISGLGDRPLIVLLPPR